MYELKNCPFCGGEAEIYRHYPPFGGRVRVAVRCTVCGCRSKEWGRVDKAVENWNRRLNGAEEEKAECQSQDIS